MNNKNIWLKISAIVFLGLIATFFFQQEPKQTADLYSNANAATNTPHTSSSNAEKEMAMATSNTHSNISSSSPTVDTEKQISAELQERIDNIRQRRPGLPFSPDEVAAAVERTTSWKPTETTPDNLPLKPEELTDGRQFIQMDTLKMETLMPGDSLNVRVDENGQDYQVIIDKVEKHDYNSISWFGHIIGDDGQKYSVSFTRGESLTVGGMDTPDGHYVLQAHGNKGWIASSQLLFKIDPNVSDVIYPEDVDPNYSHPHRHPH